MLHLQTEDSDSDSSGDELTTYTNRDGTRSSATAAELKMAAELSKDPWGRFGGRGGKMARIRAQEAKTLAAMQVCQAHTAEIADVVVCFYRGIKTVHSTKCERGQKPLHN